MGRAPWVAAVPTVLALTSPFVVVSTSVWLTSGLLVVYSERGFCLDGRLVL